MYIEQILDFDSGLDTAVQIDDSLDPADVIWHFSIDAEFAALATSLSKAGDAKDGPSVANRTEKWAT